MGDSRMSHQGIEPTSHRGEDRRSPGYGALPTLGGFWLLAHRYFVPVDLLLHLQHAVLSTLDIAELPGGVGPEEEEHEAGGDHEVVEHRDEERRQRLRAVGGRS